jgi:hypothetical protein
MRVWAEDAIQGLFFATQQLSQKLPEVCIIT